MRKSVKDILFYSAACALVAVFGILIYSASQKVAFQADASPSAPKPIIIIDAGHGGEDGGAVADDGTLEKDLNLSIATYLYQYFRNKALTLLSLERKTLLWAIKIFPRFGSGNVPISKSVWKL